MRNTIIKAKKSKLFVYSKEIFTPEEIGEVKAYGSSSKPGFFNHWISKLLGMIIFPAQFIRNDPTIYENISDKNQQYYIRMNDGEDTLLHTYEWNGKKSEASSQKYIILIGGNAESGIDNNPIALGILNSIQEINIISFDFPGVENSTGQTRDGQHMVEAVKAEVYQLIDKGVQPCNITLYGFSLGGAIASITAAQLHKEEKKVYVFNRNSFANIAKTFYAFEHHALLNFLECNRILSGILIGILSILLYKFCLPTIAILIGIYCLPYILIRVSGWILDASSSHKNIPSSFKDQVGNPNDKIIYKEASLLSSLPPNEQNHRWFSSKDLEKDAKISQHSAPLHNTGTTHPRCIVLNDKDKSQFDVLVDFLNSQNGIAHHTM